MLLNIFLPFFNFLIIVCRGRAIGRLGIMYYTIFNFLFVVVLNFYYLFLVVTTGNVVFFDLGPWFVVGLLDVHWEFMLDFLALSMLSMVSVVSMAVHCYSFDYMKTDPHFPRFISYLSLFTFFMFLIVAAANFVVLFLGWEGVGICSYILINFWFTRVQANKAALKAMIMNRVGDLGFLLGMVLLFALCHTLDFSTLAVVLPFLAEMEPICFCILGVDVLYVDIICCSFFIGVVGKSAQLGLHTWLPAAMEGPTPVSALIHAATMVTAGIFLLIRCSFLFECSLSVRTLVVIFGAFTAIFSASTALFLYDIKRIIAYSTCSQLGYMAVACGLSNYSLGLFHLINHAFFKALLFLTAGAIIHSNNNEQDIRKLSALADRAPFLHSCIVVGSIAIMGLPFLSGFYSKDVIIELVYLKASYITQGVPLIYSLIMVATICTGLYSFRLYYFLFLREGTVLRATQKPMTQPVFIILSLLCLVFGSLFSGFFLNDLFAANTKWGVGFGVLNTLYENSIMLENENLPYFIKILPLFWNLIIIVFGFLYVWCLRRGYILTVVDRLWRGVLVVEKKDDSDVWFYIISYFRSFCLFIWQLFYSNFFFNEFYNFLAYTQLSYYYTHIFLNMDKGILELVGPTGVARCYRSAAQAGRRYYKQSLPFHWFFICVTILVYYFFVGLVI